MPYVEGESLRDRIKREQRLPVGEALAIVGDVAAALTAAHGQGIARSDYLIAVHKEGYASVERIASSAFMRSERGIPGRNVEMRLTLPQADSTPDDMVAVPGGEYKIANPDLPLGFAANLHPYFIDKFEVTNKRYAAFVRSGAYAAAPLARAYLAIRRGSSWTPGLDESGSTTRPGSLSSHGRLVA